MPKFKYLVVSSLLNLLFSETGKFSDNSPIIGYKTFYNYWFLNLCNFYVLILFIGENLYLKISKFNYFTNDFKLL